MKKIGLKQKLNELIRNRGGAIVPIQEIYQICLADHYKQSNAERCLRHSESPDVIPVKNPQGAIIGYRWNTSVAKETCTKCGYWYNHAKDCPTQVKEEPKKSEGVLF